MIGTIRKHQKWLWFVIIIAIVISFVWFFSPAATMPGDDSPKADFGSINGARITPKQFAQAQREARLGMFLNYRQWPKNDERMREILEQSTYQRLVVDAKLKQLNINVTPEATARLVKQFFGVDDAHPLPIEEYRRFLQTELYPNGVSEDDFERFFAHQVGQMQLMSLFGMSGKLITTNEIASFYRRENEPIVAEAAIFSISNYLSQVAVSAKEIGEYYTNNQATYRVPQRIQVNYVKYTLTNYFAEVDKDLAAITNLNEAIEADYDKRGAASFKDASGKELTKAQAITQIKETYRKDLARNQAVKAANAFISEVYTNFSDKNPYKPDDFEKFAKSKGLTVKTTEAFDQQNGPKGISSEEFVVRAFRLAVDDPTDTSKLHLLCTSPIRTDDAVYAISLKQIFPSVIQPLETVHAEVTAAFKRGKAAELTMAAAKSFASAATNGLASGKTFNAICTAEKVKPKTLTPFSLTTQTIPEVDSNDLGLLQRAASSLPSGKSSQVIPSQDSCYVLYIEKRLTVDPEKMKTELPAYAARFRESRQSTAFGAWFDSAIKDMNVIMPSRTKM
jgi:hypothetical protein